MKLTFDEKSSPPLTVWLLVIIILMLLIVIVGLGVYFFSSDPLKFFL